MLCREHILVFCTMLAIGVNRRSKSDDYRDRVVLDGHRTDPTHSPPGPPELRFAPPPPLRDFGLGHSRGLSGDRSERRVGCGVKIGSPNGMVPWLIRMNGDGRIEDPIPPRGLKVFHATAFWVVCPTEGPCKMWKGVRDEGLRINHGAGLPSFGPGVPPHSGLRVD